MGTHRISKIISGGQTGADRAGLDVAIELGIPYGGSIPSGRRTADGHLPMTYQGMSEMKSRHYQVRTEKNVMDADATLLFTGRKMGSGSSLTRKMAGKYHKALLHINLDKKSDDEAAAEVSQWLEEVNPRILNIAGSREPESGGIYGRVSSILRRVLGEQQIGRDNNKVPGKVYEKPSMPEDAVLVKQAGQLEFYFSKAEHVLFAGITGCKGGPARLAKHEIIDLLNIIDRRTQEKEAGLLADLESDEDDF